MSRTVCAPRRPIFGLAKARRSRTKMRMGDKEHRANDDGYELDGRHVVGGGTPADAELVRIRELVAELRNPVGSVSMAIEMVLGPLRSSIEALDPDEGRRVEGTLVALSESARQLRCIVSDIGGLSSGMLEIPSSPHEPPPALLGPTAGSVTSTASGPAPRPKATVLDVGDMLRRLEILTVTRSTLPALLAVDFEGDLFIEANGPELLRALSSLVDNGIQAAAALDPGPGPWTADVRAYRRDGRVCIEVHNRGEALPDSVTSWLEGRKGDAPPPPPSTSKHGLQFVARVADAFDGQLIGHSAAEMTVMSVSFPAVDAPAKEEDPPRTQAPGG